jgi:hypothetical protein
MSFYHPELLYGLFAIAIPIIIHLFNFKRFKKVYFTNVRFLRDVKQQSKRHSQLRHLLVLASRILFVAFLVLSFARPYIPVNKQKVQSLSAVNYVSVFLDNSFSMQAKSTEGNLLEAARMKARELVLAYSASDNFRLLLNNQIPESNRFINRDRFLDLLDEVHIESSSVPISKVISRVSNFDLKQKDAQQELYIISDFQKSQADINAWKEDSNVQINLIPVFSAGQDNVFIDSCWFETPVLQKASLLKLHYRIKNLSQQNAEKIPVSLLVNGKQKALGSVDLDAFEERSEELVFKMDTAGVYHCVIEIQDFPITYDDRFYFGFNIADQINVLSISGAQASDAVKLFYANDSMFHFVEQAENRIDYSSFSNYNVIILNGISKYSSGLIMELKKYYERSGSIVIIPSNEANIKEVNRISEAKLVDRFVKKDTSRALIHWMDIESEEFNDVFDLDEKTFNLPDNVDMPFFSSHWTLMKNNRLHSIDLIKFDNGTPFLRKYNQDQSNIYLFTAAFNKANSNITAHALFVPIMYNVAMQSQRTLGLYYTLGQENIVDLQPSIVTQNEIFSISAVQYDLQFIPGVIHTGGLNALIVDENSVNDAGNYRIEYKGEEFQTCAFNYSRIESDLHSWNQDGLERELAKNQLKNINILSFDNATLSTEIKDLHNGVQLWKLFLSLAVLLLIIELFLLRFMK